jgi:hypothetical protein
MNPLDRLRRRYPWPAEKPTGRDECTGWFAGANRTALKAAITDNTRVIVELGSFQGLSSKWFAENMPPLCTLICIDHWQGSIEHTRRPDWQEKLATLHATFLQNLWPFRERVIPMKTTTLEGMGEIYDLGIEPDLIYVDASHAEEDVFKDVTTCLQRFPEAEILGDDWPHNSVRRGVVRATARCGLLAVHGCSCWQICEDAVKKDKRRPLLPKDFPQALK